MSDDNVTPFPAEDTPELLIGPFTTHRVMVEGRVIPRLTGWAQDDLIWLCVDDRFAQSFPKEYALGAATLIANALAIGAGYPCLSAETKDRPFAPIGHAIGKIES